MRFEILPSSGYIYEKTLSTAHILPVELQQVHVEVLHPNHFRGLSFYQPSNKKLLKKNNKNYFFQYYDYDNFNNVKNISNNKINNQNS